MWKRPGCTGIFVDLVWMFVVPLVYLTNITR